MESGIQESLIGVGGTSSSDIAAVSKSGVIIRYRPGGHAASTHGTVPVWVWVGVGCGGLIVVSIVAYLLGRRAARADKSA
jgi:hypothetical protein